jgi:hypothetical protein
MGIVSSIVQRLRDRVRSVPLPTVTVRSGWQRPREEDCRLLVIEERANAIDRLRRVAGSLRDCDCDCCKRAQREVSAAMSDIRQTRQRP